MAAGILGLERNWRGPLLANGAVDTTLLRFQALERAAPPRVLKSWRFLQLLYRACSDAYVRERALTESAAWTRAMGELRRAPDLGAGTACERALRLLDEAAAEARQGELRARVYALAEALFQSIHVQLSVPRYGAQAVRRGASLDGLEYPLNDRLWLHQRCAAIAALECGAGAARRGGSDPAPHRPGTGRPLRQPGRGGAAGALGDRAGLR